MKLSIDFGASTIDCVLWDVSNIVKIESFDRKKFKNFQLLHLIDKFLYINVNLLDHIAVTGGKSFKMPIHLRRIPVHKINEIEAIGKGGGYLIQNSKIPGLLGQRAGKNQNFFSKFKIPWPARPKGRQSSKFKNLPILVVSMGTGTCMVKACQMSKVKCQKLKFKIQNSKFNYHNLQIEHVGGTGVGGGTFLALCKELLGVTDVEKLVEMFKEGDCRKVDLTVRDIVGKGIGIVPGSSTASNLGKLSREISFSKSDLALGIANLIGQTIAITSIFAAKSQGISNIVFCGKLTRIQKIMDAIFSAGDIYKMGMIVPENAEYVSAIGAGI